MVALQPSRKPLSLFKRQGGLRGDREGQHCPSPEMEHLNKLTLVEVGFSMPIEEKKSLNYSGSQGALKEKSNNSFRFFLDIISLVGY